jgi:hypothetical protein
MFGTHSQWTGLRDRFGERDVIIDANGESISRLRVATTLAVDESVLTARIAQLQSFDRSTFARPLGVDHDSETGRTILLSEHVSGLRLSEVFRHSADGLVPDLSAVLFVVRRLLVAAERAQAATGLDHFGIAPERVIVTPRAEVVVVDAAIAAAVESRIRVGAPPPGAHEDIGNIARIGLSMVLGRLMTEDQYIDPLSSELGDVAEVAAIRADETFASVLRLWFEQALVTDRELSFSDFAAARETFDVADPRAAGCPPSRPAFKSFLTELGIDEFFSPESAQLETRRIKSVKARHLEKHWGTVEIASAVEEVDPRLRPFDEGARESVVSPAARGQASIIVDPSARPEPESVLIDIEATPDPEWAAQDTPEPIAEAEPQAGWLRRMFHRAREEEEASAGDGPRAELSPEPAESFPDGGSGDGAPLIEPFSTGESVADARAVESATAAPPDDEGSILRPSTEDKLPSSSADASMEPVAEHELVSDATAERSDMELEELPVAEAAPESSFEMDEPARPSWLRRAFARAREISDPLATEPDHEISPDDTEDTGNADAPAWSAEVQHPPSSASQPSVGETEPFTVELEPAAHADGGESLRASPEGSIDQGEQSSPLFNPASASESVSEGPLAHETAVGTFPPDSMAARVDVGGKTTLDVAASDHSAVGTMASDPLTLDSVPHERSPEPAAVNAPDGLLTNLPAPGEAEASDRRKAVESADDESEVDESMPAGGNAFSSDWIRDAIAQLSNPEAEIAAETEVPEDEEQMWNELESSPPEETDQELDDHSPAGDFADTDDPTRADGATPSVAEVAEEETDGGAPGPATPDPPAESWLSGALKRIRRKDAAPQPRQEPDAQFEAGPSDEWESQWTIPSDDQPGFKSLDSLFAAKAPPEHTAANTELEDEPRDETPTELDESEFPAAADADAETTEPYDPIAALMASRPMDGSQSSSFQDEPDQHREEFSPVDELTQEQEPRGVSQAARGVLGGWLARLLTRRHKTGTADVPANGQEEETAAPQGPGHEPPALAQAPAIPALPPDISWTDLIEEPAQTPPAPEPSQSTLLTASTIAQAHLNRKAPAIPGPLALSATDPEIQAKRSSGGWLKVAAVFFLVVGLGYGVYAFRELIPAPEVGTPESPTESTEGSSSPVRSPTNGSLTITSTPAGARVTIDGTSYGVTPLTVADLRPGEHTLLLEGSGGSVRRSVTVRAGATESVSEGIYSGFLAVFAPFELNILEQGRRVGTTDSSRIMLPPGRHELELVNPRVGFRETRVVNITPGETAVINILPR